MSSILINVTKFDDLGKLWKDETLQKVSRQLQKPTDSANIGGLLGNRMFWANDFMVITHTVRPSVRPLLTTWQVHRSKNYVTSLKMYSSRTTNSECINLANPSGSVTSSRCELLLLTDPRWHVSL